MNVLINLQNAQNINILYVLAVLKHLISSLPSLMKLHIQRNDGVTDDVVMTLAAHCCTLRELDVSGCINLSDKSAAHFSQFTSLRALNISQTLVCEFITDSS